MEGRIIENLHDNMIKKKIFHKDYKLNASDPTNEFERKIEKMEKDWTNKNEHKSRDILEYFEKKERETVKQSSLKEERNGSSEMNYFRKDKS
jgi:hypothetical protein